MAASLRAGGAHAAVVVDDFAPFRRLVARVLSKEGWQVHEAQSGRAALPLVVRHRPHVVIVDWCLDNGMSGLALLRAIQRRPVVAATPVVLVTALKESAEDEAQALDAGAALFLAKSEFLASSAEFVRHVEALTRAETRTLALGAGLHLDPESGALAGPGLRAVLDPQEVRLLDVLRRARGRLVTYETLWSEVWGRPSAEWLHLLTHSLSTLRVKLGPLGRRLVCRKGEGFLLEEEP